MIRSSPHPIATAAPLVAVALERFAFYAFAGGLVLSLVDSGVPDARASALYGAFLGASYMAPLLGGLAAPLLGEATCAAVGAAVLALGYLCQALGAHLAGAALALAGVGLFKPCMSAAAAMAYACGDARRTRAMSRYYLAVNVGSLPSGLAAAYLRTIDPALPWAACAAACALSCAVVLAALPHLRRHRTEIEAAVGAPLDLPPDPEVWRWRPLLALLVSGVLFFAANQQQGSTLTLWARDHLAGDPQAWSSLNPLFIILLAPLAWVAAGASASAQLAWAFAATSAGFLLLLAPGAGASALVGCYLLGAAGELLVSPLGMASVARYAPRRRAALGMALWLSTTSAGGLAAGLLGTVPRGQAATLTAACCALAALAHAWSWYRAGGTFRMAMPGAAEVRR